MDTYSQKTEQDIRDTFCKKAQSLELPLKAEQIRCTKVLPFPSAHRTSFTLTCQSIQLTCPFPQIAKKREIIGTTGYAACLRLKTGPRFWFRLLYNRYCSGRKCFLDCGRFVAFWSP